jgi:hypothetical protein
MKFMLLIFLFAFLTAPFKTVFHSKVEGCEISGIGNSAHGVYYIFSREGYLRPTECVIGYYFENAFCICCLCHVTSKELNMMCCQE